MRFLLACALAILSVLASGCRTAQVQTVAEPHTDFTKFNTFNCAHTSQSTNEDSRLTPQNRQRIQAAVINEMARRGYHLVEEPQLLIYFDLGTTVQTYDRANPPVQVGSMRANLRQYYGLNFDKSLGSQAVVHYTEGSLSFQVFDTKEDRLVWEGQAVGVLYQNRPDEAVQERIKAVVTAVFAKFPIQPK